jgi:hypothetical protein
MLKLGQVVTAFAFQAIASWLLSAILEVFLPDWPSHPKPRDASTVRRSLSTIASLREVRRFGHDFSHFPQWVREQTLRLSNTINELREEARRVEHDFPNLTQRIREMALRLSNILNEHHEETSDAPHELPQTELQKNIRKRQEARDIVAKILYFGSLKQGFPEHR